VTRTEQMLQRIEIAVHMMNGQIGTTPWTRVQGDKILAAVAELRALGDNPHDDNPLEPEAHVSSCPYAAEPSPTAARPSSTDCPAGQ
jgi:hypothetical protein